VEVDCNEREGVDVVGAMGGVVEASRFPEEVENWRWKNLVPNVPGVNQKVKVSGISIKARRESYPGLKHFDRKRR
jgi:hypothetical protein